MTSVDVILLVPVAFYSVFMVLYLCEYMYLILLAARQSGDVTLMFSMSFLCLVITTDDQSTFFFIKMTSTLLDRICEYGDDGGIAVVAWDAYHALHGG